MLECPEFFREVMHQRQRTGKRKIDLVRSQPAKQCYHTDWGPKYQFARGNRLILLLRSSVDTNPDCRPSETILRRTNRSKNNTGTFTVIGSPSFHSGAEMRQNFSRNVFLARTVEGGPNVSTPSGTANASDRPGGSFKVDGMMKCV